MAVKNLKKLNQETSENQQNPENPEDEGTYNGPNRLLACLRGAGKILRGAVATIPGLVMGVSGVGPKDTYKIVNAPIRDWWHLIKEKIKEVNQGRRWGERLGRGLLGIFTGLGTSVFNLIKDTFAGGFQLLFGGVWIVKKLKDLGLPPELTNAILKTGNPLGYLLKVSGRGVDGVNSLLEKLHRDFSKYKSLDEAAAKVKQELEQYPDLKSLMDKTSSGTQQLTESLNTQFTEGFNRVGGELNNIKNAAQKAVTSGMDYKKQIAKLYESVVNDLPGIQQTLEKSLGIPKELIQAEKNSVMIAGENSALGVKQLLADKSAKFSGVVVKARSKDIIIQGLVEMRDIDFINKLAMIKITAEDGHEKILPQHEVNALINEVKERINAIQANGNLQAADNAWQASERSEPKYR